jgi:hypothetical protein
MKTLISAELFIRENPKNVKIQKSPRRKGLVHNLQGQPTSSQTQSAFHYRREER